MFATFASGLWRQSFATPSGSSGVPIRAIRLNSTPASPTAPAETWLVTPATLTPALKRSVVPTSQLTMNPPYDSPSTPSRSGSARPSAIAWSTAAWTSSASAPPQFPRCGRIQSPPVAGRAADVREDDAVAAGAQQDDLDRGRRRPATERAAVDVHDGRAGRRRRRRRARRSRCGSGRRGRGPRARASPASRSWRPSDRPSSSGACGAFAGSSGDRDEVHRPVADAARRRSRVDFAARPGWRCRRGCRHRGRRRRAARERRPVGPSKGRSRSATAPPARDR